MVWLSALLPFAQASEVLSRIAHYDMPKTTLWEQAQQVGADWLEQDQRDYVGVERTRWNQSAYDPFLRKCVGMDGGMVYVHGEGWKELKVGVVGSLTPPWQLETDQNAHSHDLHYTACLGTADEFAPHLWQLAVQQKVPYAGHVAVTADGAGWIWRLCADLFPCSTQIVDWCHASDQAANLAQARFPDDRKKAQLWHTKLKKHLWEGNLHLLIAEAEAADLSPTYFNNHQRRMDYPNFLAAGYPVGSGSTESGVKQYKHRLCGAGMRWSRIRLERMLVLRSAAMTGDFNRRWAAVA